MPFDPNAKDLLVGVVGAGQMGRGIGQVAAVGGCILKPAQEVFWGGYSGYFADPDGHPWEVAWNPFFPILADGSIQLPG